MTVAGALPFVLLGIGVVLVALAAATVTQRVVRARAESRMATMAEPLRPVLLRLVAGEPADVAEATVRLAALEGDVWQAVEPQLERLLLKIRGETHEAVVGVLERRGTLARAVARTRSRDAVQRAWGAEVLGAARRRGAVPDLIGLLADPDDEVRHVAARALGRVGDARAAGPLLDSVSGTRTVPPRHVATALLRLGPGAHPALLRALRDGDTHRRTIAAEIAGLDGALMAVPALLEGLHGGPGTELEVRIRCARALGRIGHASGLRGLLDATAPTEPVPLRTVAARALGDLGADGAVPALTQLLDDPSHRLASNAATALVCCGRRGLDAVRAAAASGNGHAQYALALHELQKPKSRQVTA